MKLIIEVNSEKETITLISGSKSESYHLTYPWGKKVDQFQFLLAQMGFHVELKVK